MQTIEKSFSTVTQNIGYRVIADRADVPYQIVSRMVADPRPGRKWRIRKRILSAVIEEAEQRVERLRNEANEIEKQVIGLKTWRQEKFDK